MIFISYPLDCRLMVSSWSLSKENDPTAMVWLLWAFLIPETAVSRKKTGEVPKEGSWRQSQLSGKCRHVKHTTYGMLYPKNRAREDFYPSGKDHGSRIPSQSMIFWLYQGPFWWDMWWFPGGYNGISSSIRTRDINGASNLHPCPGVLELGGENRARKVALFLEKKTVAKNRYTQHLSVPHSFVCEQVCETPCNNRLFSLHPISEVVHFLVRSPSLNRNPTINIQTSMQHGAIVAGFFRAQMPELFAAPFGFSASNLDTPDRPFRKKLPHPNESIALELGAVGFGPGTKWDHGKWHRDEWRSQSEKYVKTSEHFAHQWHS